jgi:hypothetical protein
MAKCESHMHRNQRAGITSSRDLIKQMMLPRQVLDMGARHILRPGTRIKGNWLRTMKTMTSKLLSLIAAVAASSVCAALVHAQDAPADAKSDGISVELNKLEKSEKGCRAYVVVTNPTQTSYDAFKLDLVLFQTDGIIGRRFALDLAPVRPDKSTVKLFDLDGTDCESIGKFLINDVMECRTSSGPVQDCLAQLKVKSLTKVEISK